MVKLGDVLIIAGILMMAFSLYLAYTLYASLSNSGPTTGVQTPSGVSPGDAIGVLVNNMSLTIAQESYIILKIIIFFMVASIGYKFAHLGIESNKALMESEEEEDKDDISPKKGKPSAASN